ncbi:hypothetical protein BDL97_18G089600 [Sphagnum fallax]|nr:hypothetical protein BDL97_18G089600 [Sphagnum fallax]
MSSQVCSNGAHHEHNTSSFKHIKQPLKEMHNDSILHDSHAIHSLDKYTTERARDNKSVNVKISGKVQGVFFRKWTLEQAKTLGLTGWVRNSDDGTVEAVFSGKSSAVDRMVEKCKTGPSQARVWSVDINKCEDPKAQSFEQITNSWW